MVAQLEEEGKFPQADYAFDNGVLTIELTCLIESKGKHWVSEVESSRQILWKEEWRRIDEVARELRLTHPQSFRQVHVRCRNGERKPFWAFTKSVRLKRYGRKRIAIVHERSDLTDPPRFLVSDAVHWESGAGLKPGVCVGQPKCCTSSANKGRGGKRLRCARRRRSSAISGSVAWRSRSSNVPLRWRRSRNNARLPKEQSPLGNAAMRSPAKSFTHY